MAPSPRWRSVMIALLWNRPQWRMGQVGTPKRTTDSLGTRRAPARYPSRWLANPLAQPHQSRLQLGVLLQRVQRLVAAVARLFITAEREVHVSPFVVAVNPDSTGPEASRHFMSGRKIRGPDGGGKSIVAIV